MPNSLGTSLIQMVLEQAGPVLLRMPDVVRTVLRERQPGASAIAKALEHLGPAAAGFAGDLADTIVPASEYEVRRIEFPETLASVARADRATILRLLDFVRSDPDDSAAFSAADTLRRMGPDAARLVP